MSRIFFTVVSAATLAAGCAPVPPAGAGQSPLASIEMDTRSFWYALSAAGTDFVSSWQISADGTGRFRTVEWKRVGNIFKRSDVVRAIAVGRSGFRRIEALLRPAERHAGAGALPCDEVPYTDSSRGTISWARGGVTRRITYDQGCPSKDARRIFKRMSEAEKLMAAWAANGPIISSDPLPDLP